MSEEIRIELADGKYTYCYKNGVQWALRYGEQWRKLAGDNLVYNFAVKVRELEAKVQAANLIAEGYRDDAMCFRLLRKLLGYVQDGSDTTVTLFQDDATNTFHLKVGRNTYRAPGFRETLNAAAEGEGVEE